ncbi:hypothetical protein [Tortoise microvirus 7]|nr:hypothetical protein [Tortoise microvirus 7]QCS37464.1 hypothetical protein [Tortoise microvirus 105]
MDKFDIDATKHSCPLIGEQRARFSVGKYSHGNRVVVGWFVCLDDAIDYRDRIKKAHPKCLVDILQSLF